MKRKTQTKGSFTGEEDTNFIGKERKVAAEKTIAVVREHFGEEDIDAFRGSCLLPLLAQKLHGSSFLDMEKELEVMV